MKGNKEVLLDSEFITSLPTGWVDYAVFVDDKGTPVVGIMASEVSHKAVFF